MIRKALILVGLCVSTFSWGQSDTIFIKDSKLRFDTVQIKNFKTWYKKDTLKATGKWSYLVVENPKDSILYEARYKSSVDHKGMDGIAFEPNVFLKGDFILQEQKKKKGKIVWKHQVWGDVRKGEVREREYFRRYNEEGKVRSTTRGKSRYNLY